MDAPDPLAQLTRGLWLLVAIVACGIAFAWVVHSSLQATTDTLARLDAKAIAYGQAHGGYRHLTVSALAGRGAGPVLYLVHRGPTACLYYAGSYALLQDPETDQVRLYDGECPFSGPPAPFKGPKA